MNTSQSDKEENWKKKYGKVNKYTLENTNTIVYCKKPTFSTYLAYLKTVNEKDTLTAINELFYECLISHKKEEIEDDTMLAVGKAMVEEFKKEVVYSIDATPNKDEHKKSAALIRNAFHVDPYQLTVDEFFKLLEEALWLQKHKFNKLEKAIISALATQN